MNITMHTVMYSERWDAHYSPLRNRWLDDRCDDPECEYCVDRPERPLEVKDELRDIQRPSSLNETAY